MRRFVKIATVVAVLAGIAVPVALALGFDPYNPTLPDATVGVPYSFQQTARGGCPPYTFTVSSGSLPGGIQLQTNGLFNGTPTQPGTASFYADLADSCGFHAQRPFTMMVIPKVTVTTQSPLATGIVGVPYSLQFAADGAGAFTWSLISGTLPAGLTFSSSGLLAGTPTTAAPATTFVVKAKDSTSDRSDTKQLSIEVLAPLAATVGSAPASEVGIDFKGITPTATGGKAPYVWSAVGLPEGLIFDPATGAITGTPTVAGAFTAHLTLGDTTTAKVNVDVPITVAAKLSLVTLRLPSIKVGGAYQAVIRTRGGVSPIKWKVTSGRFPVGIRLDTKAGVIAGKPRKAGVFTITVTVTDRLGATAEQNYTFTIKAKPKPKVKK